jgi:membrane protein
VLTYFDSSLSWRELLTRTVRETQSDNGLGLAAQLAYYFFLSLFPAVIVLLALASFLPATDLLAGVVSLLQGVAPAEVVAIVREQLGKIAEARQGGLLSLGMVAALWSSSAAMVAIIDALNRAYDVKDQRPWWKQRATAILLTLGVAAFIVISSVLVLAGPQIAEFLTDRLGFAAVFEWTWKIVQWPVAFALVVTAIGLIYYFAPDVDQDFVWITPGSLVATILWLAASLAFRFYVVNFGSYNETYGAIGGIMILLVWLYLTGLVIIIGAEMNAEIEHASPHGKDSGEQVPGQRKTIGPRAARELRDQSGAPTMRRPLAPASVRRRSSALGTAFARTVVVIGGTLASLVRRRVH